MTATVDKHAAAAHIAAYIIALADAAPGADAFTVDVDAIKARHAISDRVVRRVLAHASQHLNPLLGPHGLTVQRKPGGGPPYAYRRNGRP